MSSAVQDQSDTSSSIDERLDELIPRPAPMWRRTVGGGLLIAIVAAVSLLWSLGYLVPKPLRNGSFGGSFALEIHEPGQTAMIRRSLPNFGNRSVRLTDLTLDAPGAELVATTARVEPTPVPERCVTTTSGSMTSTVCESETIDFSPGIAPRDAQALPIVIGPDEWLEYYLWIQPTDCAGDTHISYPWGTITATFDFGDGAFPPVSRSYELPSAVADQPGIVPIRGIGPAISDPDDNVLDQLCQSQQAAG